MNFLALFQNKALIAGLSAWALAQVIKIPLDYLRTRRWNWSLLLTTGGALLYGGLLHALRVVDLRTLRHGWR